MENRLPKFGQNEGTYAITPPGHTGVCWAGQLGAASRGHSQDSGEVIAARALARLADGTAECICARRRAKRKRAGRVIERPGHQGSTQKRQKPPPASR